MPKYKKKPPVFDALQFTGGSASATAIVQGISAVAPGYNVRFQPASSEFGMQEGVVTEFKTAQRLKIELMDGGTIQYAPVGSWVTASREGTVVVFTDADFVAQYEPV